ncbi:hypothetical protein Sango_3106400 [Sesamum angolense]|uniref:Retroviral polymerase SH3-like domain-containing protein n=1 Tax=Sesamum angolense TaxID=2727404 RepID=A0AAE1T957_9LAMI|nr:hypothetical protein Sango_3106400 [Sesamum angolense]
MIRSMMSFTELPLSFWGYALETAARLLNIAISKTVAQMPYQIWHGKPASYKYLRVLSEETAGYYFYDISEQKVFVSRNAVFLERGFPTDTRRDELLLEESSKEPQSNAGTSSPPTVSTDNVPILRRKRSMHQPEGFTVVGEEQKVQDGTLQIRFLSMRHGVMLSKKQSPKTDKELKKMLDIPYASAVGSIQYLRSTLGLTSLTL